MALQCDGGTLLTLDPDGGMRCVSVGTDGAVDVTNDAPFAMDAARDADTATDAGVDVAADTAPPLDAGLDAAIAPDRPAEDSSVSTSCATRAAAGACTPGVDPGCDIVDVSIGSGLYPGPCVVFADGSVRCWSERASERVYLGNGATQGCVAPGLVLGLTGASRVVQGGSFTCALRPSAPMPVWCWGLNNQRQFGVEAPGTSLVPMATPIPPGALALGGDGSGFSVSAAGVVTAWGGNRYGQLGDGTTSVPGVAPHTVALAGLRQLAIDAANGWVTCGVFTGGQVRCWGWGQGGHFGTAMTPVTSRTQSPTPVAVPGITSARDVQVAPRFACALRDDATLWCWGLGNDPMMAGAGLTPTQVLDRVTQVAVAGAVACAVREDQTVWCWGSTFLVGNGGGDALVPSPVAVAGLAGVRRVYAGGTTVCAWLGGADLRCWGNAPGAGTRASPTPVRVVW